MRRPPIGVAEPLSRKLDESFEKMLEKLKAAAEETAKAMDEAAKKMTPEQIRTCTGRLAERLYA